LYLNGNSEDVESQLSTIAAIVNEKTDKVNLETTSGNVNLRIMAGGYQTGDLILNREDDKRGSIIRAYNALNGDSYVSIRPHDGGGFTDTIEAARFTGYGDIQVGRNLIIGSEVITEQLITNINSVIATSSPIVNQTLMTGVVTGGQSLISSNFITFTGTATSPLIFPSNNIFEITDVGHYVINLEIEAEGNDTDRVVNKLHLQMYSGSTDVLTFNKTYNIGGSNYHRGIDQARKTVCGGTTSFFVDASMVSAGCLFKIMTKVISVESPGGTYLTNASVGSIRIERNASM
jgi:hypothetical protein